MESTQMLETYSTRALRNMIEEQPWLSTYYRLFKANGEVSATHWSMIRPSWLYEAMRIAKGSIPATTRKRMFALSSLLYSFDTSSALFTIC